MNVIEKICQKLAEWETSINSIPVENRKGIIMKVCVVSFLFMLVCTLGTQIIRSHYRESQKENEEQPTATLDSLYKKVDKDLTSINTETQRALRLVDSLSKNQKGNE